MMLNTRNIVTEDFLNNGKYGNKYIALDHKTQLLKWFSWKHGKEVSEKIIGQFLEKIQDGILTLELGTISNSQYCTASNRVVDNLVNIFRNDLRMILGYSHKGLEGDCITFTGTDELGRLTKTYSENFQEFISRGFDDSEVLKLMTFTDIFEKYLETALTEQV